MRKRLTKKSCRESKSNLKWISCPPLESRRNKNPVFVVGGLILVLVLEWGSYMRHVWYFGFPFNFFLPNILKETFLNDIFTLVKVVSAIPTEIWVSYRRCVFCTSPETAAPSATHHHFSCMVIFVHWGCGCIHFQS